MATLSTTSLNWLANSWEDLYASAVVSGIIGDLAHKLRGGYHISIQDQGSSNYSVVRPDDKAPPGKWARDRASAIDMTMNTADMKKCHVRIRNAYLNRATDPRMKYINAWNGWDGQGDAGRYDVVKGTVGVATPDHKWHIHLEIRRRYVNDMVAMKAILSILKGESVATYKASIAPKPPVVVNKPTAVKPPTPVIQPVDGGKDLEDMTQDEFNKLYLGAITSAAVQTQMKARPWQYVGGGIEPGYSTLSTLHEMHLTLRALAKAVATEGTNPQELKDALEALPGPEAVADAVVEALGSQPTAEIAETLRVVLGPEKVAALKAAL